MNNSNDIPKTVTVTARENAVNHWNRFEIEYVLPGSQNKSYQKMERS